MFNVIVDTREQKPWTFALSSSVDNIISRDLKTGDYAIEGLEDILCIERKANVAEFAGNITEKRFTRELIRMEKFPYKFIILEFNYYAIDQYPMGSQIPKRLHAGIKVTGGFIMKFISEIQVKYGIHVVPCCNSVYAEHVATNIMKRVYESRNN